MGMLDHAISIASQPHTGDTIMNPRHQRYNLSRLAIAGAFLLTGLAGATQAATAGPTLTDNGGPGEGDEVATRPIFLEELGLVSTNDPSVPITANPALDGPSLVGSGPDREIVSNSVAQQAGSLDETARSIDLIALSPQSSSTIAIAPTEARFGQPF